MTISLTTTPSRSCSISGSCWSASSSFSPGSQSGSRCSFRSWHGCSMIFRLHGSCIFSSLRRSFFFLSWTFVSAWWSRNPCWQWLPADPSSRTAKRGLRSARLRPTQTEGDCDVNTCPIAVDLSPEQRHTPNFAARARTPGPRYQSSQVAARPRQRRRAVVSDRLRREGLLGRTLDVAGRLRMERPGPGVYLPARSPCADIFRVAGGQASSLQRLLSDRGREIGRCSDLAPRAGGPHCGQETLARR